MRSQRIRFSHDSRIPRTCSLIAVLASVSLILVGCALPLEASFESRQEYVNKHNLSGDVEEAILAGRVIVDVTREEVEATWGWPSETATLA